MLLTSIILFAVAAAIGLTLIIPLLKEKPVSKTRAILHGSFAATALVILVIFSINSEAGSPILSIVLFIIAAIGGLTLFVRHLNGNPGPKGLALIHAGAAVIAFLILLIFFFNN